MSWLQWFLLLGILEVLVLANVIMVDAYLTRRAMEEVGEYDLPPEASHATER